jgi:hypothetical protein
VHRPERRARDRALGVGGQAGDPEVGDHRAAVAGEQDVARLHVAVDDAAHVCDAERTRDVGADPCRFGRGEASTSSQAGGEVLALDQLHDEVRLGVVGAGLEAGDDVRVTQDRGGERLASEAHRDVGVLDGLASQQLDRDGPVEPRVERPMDCRHPAAADDLGETVPAVDEPTGVGGGRRGIRGSGRLGHAGTIAEVRFLSPQRTCGARRTTVR